jgi:hypothetical protein
LGEEKKRVRNDGIRTVMRMCGQPQVEEFSEKIFLKKAKSVSFLKPNIL